jgi:hypothetical protein
VLGLVVTDALYRSHPDLSEGRLAKLRAASSTPARWPTSARTLGLAASAARPRRGDHRRARQELDPRRHRRGASSARSTSTSASRPPRSRAPLFDPLLAEAASLGAGAGLEDQPAGAVRQHRARAAGVPREPREGPDHAKTFTAQVRVADHVRGTAPARIEEAGRAAGRRGSMARDQRRSPRPARARRAESCRSCPRSRSSAPASSVTSPARASSRPSVEVHPAFRTPPSAPARTTSPPGCRPHPGRGPPARQVPVAAARRRRCLLVHLGMSGQLLVVQPTSAPAERTCGSADADDGGLELRFVDQRMFGALARSPGGAELPPQIAHIARDPLDPPSTRRLRRACVRSGAPASSARCSTRRWCGIGNIYADEALWRARLHYARPTETLRAAEVTRLLAEVRTVMNEALASGRYLVRCALRRRQRPERLLRPQPGRLRPAWPPVPTLRRRREA